MPSDREGGSGCCRQSAIIVTCDSAESDKVMGQPRSATGSTRYVINIAFIYSVAGPGKGWKGTIILFARPTI